MTDAQDPQVDDEVDDLPLEEDEGPLGPTGRPLHPIGAYFEAAFRRFGINFGGYLLYTVACGLLPVGVALINSASNAPAQVQLLLFSLAYVLGNVLLIALSTVLVTGATRERLPSVAVATLATGVLGGLIVWQISVFAVVIYPLIVLPPIIAASGDAVGLRALVEGVRLTLKWFRRVYACMFGLVLVVVGVWFGFTVLLSPVQDGLQQQVAFAITTLLIWPIAALVFRNLYGDMTGRLVINAAPKENEYRRDLVKRRRERAKRNRKRIKKATGEE